ncbi:MAG TPA: RlpA-like double-psi beta-barrel domain-containing protein [Actinomycetota bacterium]|nr:RlpA-like double-psi beta-barrel domain-containing protein [Actinomycetota bacterium]
MNALLLGAALVVGTVPAAAQTVEDDLDDARRREAAAEAEAALAEAGLDELARQYAEVQVAADRAAARLVDAYLQESAIQAEVARSRALLNGRADAIYRAGPAAFLDVMLESEDPGDFLARQQLVEHALSADVREAAAALEVREEASGIRQDLERHRAELVARQQELIELRTIMEIRLAEARAEAEAAGERVQALVQQQRALARAAEKEQRYTKLIQVDGALAKLLELLGPTGGRGCRIPPDLASTGQGFTGEASFYGEEFAGNPTAIGHIFNPDLFTAAHRTLPLPSFLHVRYGERCATVLVNDRGPYVDGRVLDLSEGAARYLGLPGVGIVQAEILAPA